MMMERIILGVLYLSGWYIFSCLTHQYHYVADPMNWTEAQTYCRQTYTDLATIRNNEEVNQFISTVSSFDRSSLLWIGLYSKIDWRWSDGYNGTGAGYEKRFSGGRFFHTADQSCVFVNSKGEWWDYSCSRKEPFICDNGTQLSPDFVFINEAMNWSSAQRYCRENFRDLATVRNDAENQEIQSLVKSGWASIGLFGDQHIYSSDGSNYSFSYWSTVFINAGSNVSCGAIQRSSRKCWFISCETRLPFVCYSVRSVMRQVVKLRIKPGGSVDLNDPAVKEGILTQLQDKLKDKGVSGVTLKWRVQPDGKVFHKEKSSQKQKRRKTEL